MKLSDLKNKHCLFICEDFLGLHQQVAKELTPFFKKLDFCNIRPVKRKKSALLKCRHELAKGLYRLFPNAYCHRLSIIDKARVVEQHSQDRPDLIIVFGVFLDKYTLQRFRATHQGVKILFWNWNPDHQHHIKGYFDQYDDACTFDPVDASRLGIRFRPQFYFSAYQPHRLWHERKIDLLYVGANKPGRLEYLAKWHEYAIAHNLNFHCHLYSPIPPANTQLPADWFSDQSLSIDQIAALANNTKVLLDIKRDRQHGPTLRPLEAIGSGCKLITNHHQITEYDFYKEANVWIVDRHRLRFPPPTFFGSPPLPYGTDVQNRYTVAGWLEDLINGL